MRKQFCVKEKFSIFISFVFSFFIFFLSNTTQEMRNSLSLSLTLILIVCFIVVQVSSSLTNNSPSIFISSHGKTRWYELKQIDFRGCFGWDLGYCVYLTNNSTFNVFSDDTFLGTLHDNQSVNNILHFLNKPKNKEKKKKKKNTQNSNEKKKIK